MKISIGEPNLTALEAKYVQEALDSGWISSKGEFVSRFEEQFAEYLGVRHAISVNSGTSALQLAYASATKSSATPFHVSEDTFQATHHMAHLVSSEVHLLPPDRSTWNIRLDKLAQATGVIVGVHLYGNPIEMSHLPRLKAIFLEDCAQALGSEFHGQKLGTFGLLSCFSFYANKTITTGEGGMICTNDDKLADGIRLMNRNAMIEPYIHHGLGFNFRMTNIQAAIGLAQLERIEELLAKKQQITKWYDSMLGWKFKRQASTKGSRVIKWMNAYKHKQAKAIRITLAENGIETRPGFLDPEVIVFPSGTKLTKTDVESICHEADHAVGCL